MGYFKYLKKLKALRDISVEDLLGKVGLSVKRSSLHSIPTAVGLVVIGAALGAGAVWMLSRKNSACGTGCCCCDNGECDGCYGSICTPCVKEEEHSTEETTV